MTPVKSKTKRVKAEGFSRTWLPWTLQKCLLLVLPKIVRLLPKVPGPSNDLEYRDASPKSLRPNRINDGLASGKPFRSDESRF